MAIASFLRAKPKTIFVLEDQREINHSEATDTFAVCRCRHQPRYIDSPPNLSYRNCISISQLLTSNAALHVVSSLVKIQIPHQYSTLKCGTLFQRKFAQMTIKKTDCDFPLFPVMSGVCSTWKKVQRERSLPFLLLRLNPSITSAVNRTVWPVRTLVCTPFSGLS